ncbi:MAG: ABC transporter ATP-binding protein, partial [Proteobacteria bacterium]|nr:ABC transporter ATP-binding protein [Pseudomonadota bacterium]
MDLETPTRSGPKPAPAPSEPVLRVENLRTHFIVGGRRLRAVDGVSFDLHRGETLGLVGESGCGKSVSALSILRLIKSPPGEIVGGSVHFGGQDLLKMPMPELRQLRGNEISVNFQEPRT